MDRGWIQPVFLRGSCLVAGRVECVAFNALRDLVATCGADGRLSIVAADSGKQVNAFNGTDEPMMQLAFSPDDEKVAGVTADGKLLIYFVGSTGAFHDMYQHVYCVRLPCLFQANGEEIPVSFLLTKLNSASTTYSTSIMYWLKERVLGPLYVRPALQLLRYAHH